MKLTEHVSPVASSSVPSPPGGTKRYRVAVAGLPVSGMIVHVPSHVVLPAGVEEPVPVPLRANTPGSAMPPRQSTDPVLQAG